MIFKAPEYKDQSVEAEVKVFLQLICPYEKKPLINSIDSSSHKYESKKIEFIYVPKLDNQNKKRKITSIEDDYCNEIMIQHEIFENDFDIFGFRNNFMGGSN